LLAAILIFAGTYLVLAVGRIPFLRVDRTIVVQRARAEVEISFGEYARAGVPLTVLSVAAGVWLLN
jgi:hypothetical protein